MCLWCALSWQCLAHSTRAELKTTQTCHTGRDGLKETGKSVMLLHRWKELWRRTRLSWSEHDCHVGGPFSHNQRKLLFCQRLPLGMLSVMLRLLLGLPEGCCACHIMRLNAWKTLHSKLHKIQLLPKNVRRSPVNIGRTSLGWRNTKIIRRSPECLAWTWSGHHSNDMGFHEWEKIHNIEWKDAPPPPPPSLKRHERKVDYFPKHCKKKKKSLKSS